MSQCAFNLKEQTREVDHVAKGESKRERREQGGEKRKEMKKIQPTII